MKRVIVASLLLLAATVPSTAHAQDRKPVIGVEADIVKDPKTGELRAHVSEAYLQAVRDAGGEPLVLSPFTTTVDAALARVDGIVLTGGPDLPPELYGEKAITDAALVDPKRLAFATELVTKATAKGVPMLGICLGNQLLNVLRKGKLLPDIPTLVKDALPHRRTGDDHDAGETHHPIEVVKGSQLALATGEKLDVNSYHHQSVAVPGEGLRVVAKAPDGVIEAVESEDPARFVTGVQWHPERLPVSSPGRRVFDKLVLAAKGFASARTEGLPLDVIAKDPLAVKDPKAMRDAARAAGVAKDLRAARDRPARPVSAGLVKLLDRTAEARDGERDAER